MQQQQQILNVANQSVTTYWCRQLFDQWITERILKYHDNQTKMFMWSKYVCAVSRRVLNRMTQKLSAHARSTSDAVTRYKTEVDHVTRFIGRFERHLAATLDVDWLTFPNKLSNLSLASERRDVSWNDDSSQSSLRTLQLANLLEVDEVHDVYSWTQRFWTRSNVCTAFSLHLNKSTICN